MPAYRVHRLRAHLRHGFRNAPHVSGAATVKPRDYIAGDTIEAATPYAAYFTVRETENRLEPGDLLETEAGELRIFKFVGFEEARWVQPEPQPESQETQAAPAEPAAIE